MPNYSCDICNFKTKLKTDYNRHITTRKHLDNTIESGNPSYTYEVMNTNEHKVNTSVNTNEHTVNTNEHKMNTNSKNSIWCEFCGKTFKSKPSMKRHIKNYCKKADNIDYEKLYLKSEKEKEQLYDKISQLIDKVGDTNIQNNIIVNSYGQEDLSHITDSMKTELLQIPFGAIPKMIEYVHYDENKPENYNIVMPNKKDNKLLVLKNNKWIYKDKDQTITDLMDSKYTIIDDHYEKIVAGKLGENASYTNYVKFRKVYDEGDKEFIDKLKKECEIALLNGRKKINNI
jgi:hypothetical protein